MTDISSLFLCAHDLLGEIFVTKPITKEELWNQIKAKLAGYEGELICPSFDRVCTGTVWCNDPFECIDKKSLLYVKPKSFSLLSILLKMLYCLLLIVCLLAIVILYLKLHKHRRMKQRRFVEII